MNEIMSSKIDLPERGPDRGRRGMLLPWQCGPGCRGGRWQGLPCLNVKNLERGGEENSPGHLCDPSRHILHRQEGYGGREGKGDGDINGGREENE